MVISLQIVELWGVGEFPPPIPGLTDLKKPGLNRVNDNSNNKHSIFYSVFIGTSTVIIIKLRQNDKQNKASLK